MDAAAPPRASSPSQFKNNPAEWRTRLPHFCFIVTIFGLTIGTHQINYLFFHSFVEIFSIVMACGIFILAWHTQKIIENNLFLFIGIAYLFISGLDLVHTLSYPGMGIFPQLSAEEPLQIWVATRFIESVALFIAPSRINKNPRPMLWATAFALASSGALCMVFVWPVMPQCFSATQGLTPFKLGSGYVISLILIAAIVSLYKQRASLEKDTWRLLRGAIGLTIASEMAFTFYVDAHGIAHMIGLCLKIGSVFLFYIAIIGSGFIRPHNRAIQTLQQKETVIKEGEAVFKTIINASTDMVVLIDDRLCFVAANQAAARAFNLTPDDIGNRRITEMVPNGISGDQLNWIREVLSGGRPVQYEERQDEATLLYSIYPITNDVGHVVQLAVFRKDITKQRESHHALVESEAKFRMLAEQIEDIFWIATPDVRRFVYVSPAYETIIGKPSEELYHSTKSLMAMIHPDDRYEVRATAQRLPLDEWEIEFRILRPNGAVRWVQNRGYSIKDEQGRVVQTCGVARDITDRNNLEQRLVAVHHELEQRVEDRTCALSVAIQQLKHQVAKRTKMGAVIKEKHSMLNTLLQAIPDRVCFKNTEGCYQLTNNAFEAYYGLKGKNVAGRTDVDFKSAEEARITAERDRRVIQQGHALRFESRLPATSNTDGSHWDVRKVPVKDGTGTIIGILSLSRNITDFKQREAQLKQNKAVLRAFLDGISDPMVMMDQNLRLVYINRAATLAYPNRDSQYQAGNCFGMLCDGQRTCSECFVPSLISQKEQHSFEHVRTGNPERIEMVDIYPLSQDQDGLDGAIVRIRDITRAKLVERQMIHSEKMASLGMLISGIAHEINNPNSFITFNLPILNAYLEKILAVMDAQPHAVSHRDWFGMDYNAFRQEIFSLLGNLSHGSIRIDNIVSNLKAMAHPKPPEQCCKWTDIQGVIDKAVTLCRGEIKKHVSTFEVEQAPTTVEAYADPECLEQVLINLLINAAQAADKPDAWIRLRALPPDDTNRFVLIEVHDNGCGMDPVTRDSVFDPFFTTKAPGVGTGLGLSVSYNLIAQMGGQIRVESTPDHGATFTIQLPIQMQEAVEDKREQQVRPSNFYFMPPRDDNP